MRTAKSLLSIVFSFISGDFAKEKAPGFLQICEHGFWSSIDASKRQIAAHLLAAKRACCKKQICGRPSFIFIFIPKTEF